MLLPLAHTFVFYTSSRIIHSDLSQRVSRCLGSACSILYQHESAIGIHMSPPSGSSLPPPTPFHHFRLLQSPGLSSVSHTANSHWLSILHMVVYMFPCYFLRSSHPLLPPAACAHLSLFSMSVSPLLPCK